MDRPEYIQQSLDKFLKPPEKMKVSEWAEKYRILDKKSSAIAGKWNNEVTPYLVGIMDEANNFDTEEIVFCKPTQVGGTEAINNILGYFIHLDPSPTMLVYPSDTLAESISKNRLEPMFLASKVLRNRYKKYQSDKLEMQFDGMYLSLTGANSPSQLASKPIRILLMDEVDKMPPATKKEADPISLARERTKTFFNRLIVMASTPTTEDGHIWKNLKSCDIEKHFFVPCPHCGEYIELQFAQIKWNKKEDGQTEKDRAETAVYICQKCGCIIEDRYKTGMIRHGEWRIVEERSKYHQKIGFWLNTLYSPFVSFVDIAKEFIVSQGDPDRMQNFVNSWLAEPWVEEKLKTDADTVKNRQTNLAEFMVPSWAKLLTAGVDVQTNKFYWTIRAWGKHMTSQNVCHGTAYSFSEIEDIMNLDYPCENGGKKTVDLCLMDSGYDTGNVYNFCIRNSDWCVACKGANRSLKSYYDLSTVNKDNNLFGIHLLYIDTDKYKDDIARRMGLENGRGSWMVHANIDDDYCDQVTAEHKIIVKSGGRKVEKWKQKRKDNHYLDAEVYAACAADFLGVRRLFLEDEESSRRRKIEKAEDIRLNKIEEDEFDLGGFDDWFK